MNMQKAFLTFVIAMIWLMPAARAASQSQSNPTDVTPQNQTSAVEPMDQTPTYRVTVVARTTKAVNYHFRSGATKVDLKGTDLMPNASGTVRVESHPGRIALGVDVKGLESPQKFGTEYLTYVLWGITPEGRSKNLGEILPGEHRKIDVTTDLQAFGLTVTAEPYFGVTQPSDLVVMENLVRPDTVGAAEYIDAHYELVGRGQYIPKRAAYEGLVLDPKVPIYLQEAGNAVRIAQLAGVERYASESFGKAANLLQQAEDYQARKKPEKKPIATVARQAVQAAEDSRVITVRRREEERANNERQASANREAVAQGQAEQESQRRVNAEADTADAVRAREEADRQNRNAQNGAEQAARGQAEAEQGRALAQQQEHAAQAESDRNRAAAEASGQQLAQSEREREELRARLLQQFNTILETRDTVRGLVVNMSDVLFDSGQYTLRPLAREKLAKISGVVLGYPGLRLAIEGNTDSVGSDAYNQTLSEKRADSVRIILPSKAFRSPR